mmetsp:Transcript_48324/g.147009  ORF Transcript_48324/g.147009 Transcript_48324/m.147009 type:complete len:201 (-) Transcript_48324:633-1235(-)
MLAKIWTRAGWERIVVSILWAPSSNASLTHVSKLCACSPMNSPRMPCVSSATEQEMSPAASTKSTTFMRPNCERSKLVLIVSTAVPLMTMLWSKTTRVAPMRTSPSKPWLKPTPHSTRPSVQPKLRAPVSTVSAAVAVKVHPLVPQLRAASPRKDVLTVDRPMAYTDVGRNALKVHEPGTSKRSMSNGVSATVAVSVGSS